MVALDKTTGNVRIKGLEITPNTLLSELEDASGDFELTMMVANAGYHLHRIKWASDEDPIPCLQFYEDELLSVDIGVGYQLDETGKRDAVLAVLKQLGGERKYDWGEVKEVIDDKGGDHYVLISYRN